MIAATLAAEDPRFFEHSGVDLTGFARALIQTLESRNTPSGGSTIEMQLARNLFLSDERADQTLSRKLRESAAAIQLDRQFQKREILEAYLNVAYYGSMAHGVEAAAETYFGKPARDLNLAESSLLAGLPQSPTVLNPLVNLDAARERQRYVLDQMVELWVRVCAWSGRCGCDLLDLFSSTLLCAADAAGREALCKGRSTTTGTETGLARAGAAIGGGSADGAVASRGWPGTRLARAEAAAKTAPSRFWTEDVRRILPMHLGTGSRPQRCPRSATAERDPGWERG